MLKRVITLRTALDEYYVTDRVIEQSTYKRYVYDCNRWEKYTRNPDVRDVTEEVILKYRKKLLSKKLSVNTINPNLKTIYYLLKTCLGEGLLETLPKFGVPMQQTAPLPMPIPFSNLEKFLEFTHVASWPADSGYWNRYIGTAYLTGLRRGDLRRITREDCSRENIQFKAKKTGKTHYWPMPDWLWRMIKPQSSGVLFPVDPKQIYQEMRRIAKAAGVKYFSPKDLRILSSNEWENAWPGAGAVIQGAAIPGWTKATVSYLTTHGLLFRGIENLKAPEPLLSEAEKNKGQSDRIKWQKAFEQLPQVTREQLLGIADSLAKSDR